MGMGMGQSLEYPLPAWGCSDWVEALSGKVVRCLFQCATTTTRTLLPPLMPSSYPPSHSSCLVPPSTLLALSSVLRIRPSHVSIRRHALGMCTKHWWLLGSGGGRYTHHGYTPTPIPIPMSTGTYPWRVRVWVGLETPASLPVWIPTGRQLGVSDPISSLLAHFAASPAILETPTSSHLSAYAAGGGRLVSLTKRKFLLVCNSIWAPHGLPRISGDCFRIGGTTELLLRNVPPHIVKVMGRWSWNTLLLCMQSSWAQNCPLFLLVLLATALRTCDRPRRLFLGGARCSPAFWFCCPFVGSRRILCPVMVLGGLCGLLTVHP
ncbi:uncharacterized protein F5891DRAFT_1280496 [Suillus fuscotomentosus]|uniref:Uncharacterized protein n=1 Tax=Suillus fuscotomentosus TaxID=1912939 RepID=A0AAD4DYT6_9AGAM|nr:uncharacterized protein F5891DRAFT_1280496 [Suillus fuscotomentosus]KAG1896633.1 hypothetical protein F5891DRAFT_1280496 [Suillus fuscotomentosus]